MLSSNVADVDTLGNVWIVTVDDSGSMLKLSANPWHDSNVNIYSQSELAKMVSKRMSKYPFDEWIDYKHDRFLFFRSGYSYDKNRGLGNELAVAASLDSSFIHHTDAKLHYFESKERLINHIGDLINEGEFKNELSFVSHIRTFSVVKAVNMLRKMGEEANFNSLKLLTITDDADQNDQWRVDYKVLATADKLTKGRSPISQRVKDTIQRYVYNELSGLGAGTFDPIFTDDDQMPHMWIYEYSTVDSKNEIVVGNVLSISGKALCA